MKQLLFYALASLLLTSCGDDTPGPLSSGDNVESEPEFFCQISISADTNGFIDRMIFQKGNDLTTDLNMIAAETAIADPNNRPQSIDYDSAAKSGTSVVDVLTPNNRIYPDPEKLRGCVELQINIPQNFGNNNDIRLLIGSIPVIDNGELYNAIDRNMLNKQLEQLNKLKKIITPISLGVIIGNSTNAVILENLEEIDITTGVLLDSLTYGFDVTVSQQKIKQNDVGIDYNLSILPNLKKADKFEVYLQLSEHKSSFVQNISVAPKLTDVSSIKLQLYTATPTDEGDHQEIGRAKISAFPLITSLDTFQLEFNSVSIPSEWDQNFKHNIQLELDLLANATVSEFYLADKSAPTATDESRIIVSYSDSHFGQIDPDMTWYLYFGQINEGMNQSQYDTMLPRLIPTNIGNFFSTVPLRSTGN